MSKVIAVVGPTASGKTAMGVQLAKQFNGEVINGDSIAVYRQLNIASAKVTEEEMEGIPHHLVNYKDVGENYDVYTFQKDARAAIDDIVTRGKVPIVVGGTGLYIKALLYDYSFDTSATPKTCYDGIPTEQLYQKLVQLDPVSCEKIHPNNRRRIERALQIAESGTLKSETESQQSHEMIYDAKVVGLTMPRELLHQRISLRIDKMKEMGLLEEVEQLAKQYSFSDHGMHGIGYREFQDYFEKGQSLEETLQLIKTHTNQFAKRQYTWWNHQMQLTWYDITEQGYQQRLFDDIQSWLKERQ